MASPEEDKNQKNTSFHVLGVKDVLDTTQKIYSHHPTDGWIKTMLYSTTPRNCLEVLHITHDVTAGFVNQNVCGARITSKT